MFKNPVHASVHTLSCLSVLCTDGMCVCVCVCVCVCACLPMSLCSTCVPGSVGQHKSECMAVHKCVLLFLAPSSVLKNMYEVVFFASAVKLSACVHTIPWVDRVTV